MAMVYQTANLSIFLQWPSGAQPPNFIPANISGYTVFSPGVSSNLALCLHYDLTGSSGMVPSRGMLLS